MTDRPTLSVCVPSRNRQDTFRQTIADLLANPRPDVEFIFADNSDDPSIMNDVMAAIDDSRVRYLPTTDEILPMQDNWERSIDATTGDWIVFIGDDDYVDPDVADVILEILRQAPETEAIAWNRAGFKWPSYRPFPGNLSFSLRNDVTRVDRASLVRLLFTWENASVVPSAPFTIYHGAIARPVVDKIRRSYGGRTFEHPTVDYDFGAKLLFSASNFVMANRPLSILGACEKSNSAAIGRFSRVKEVQETFMREKGGAYESGGAMDDFPFKSYLGVAAAIMAAQHWFKGKYGIRIDGWQENFVRSLAMDCSRAIDRSEFDTHVDLCRRAVESFEGGRYARSFSPRFTGGSAGMFTGLRGSILYLDERIGDCSTPAELYGILQSMLEPASALNFDIGVEALVDAA